MPKDYSCLFFLFWVTIVSRSIKISWGLPCLISIEIPPGVKFGTKSCDRTRIDRSWAVWQCMPLTLLEDYIFWNLFCKLSSFSPFSQYIVLFLKLKRISREISHGSLWDTFWHEQHFCILLPLSAMPLCVWWWLCYCLWLLPKWRLPLLEHIHLCRVSPDTSRGLGSSRSSRFCAQFRNGKVAEGKKNLIINI